MKLHINPNIPYSIYNVTLKILGLLIILNVFLSNIIYPQAQTPTQPESSYQLQITHADEAGLILEFHLLDFHLNQFNIENKLYQTDTYQHLSVADLHPLTTPGQPNLPGISKLLGIPSEGIADINILESDTETLTNIHLLPTPTLIFDEQSSRFIENINFDPAIYTNNTFFPSEIAMLGITGKLRDQPIAQLRLFPFQYNPVQHTLNIHHYLRIQILFATPTQISIKEPNLPPSTPYQNILEKTLFNSAYLPQQESSPSTQTLSKDEDSLQTPITTQHIQATSTQSISPALKIFITENGLYQITYQDLQTAGFPLNTLNPHYLHLTNNNNAIAIYITGEDDNSFDPTDTLEFYAEAPISEFTNYNVYWLTVQNTPGLRMATQDVTPTSSGNSPPAFYTTHHLEENHEYWQQLPNGAGQDHWFWERTPSSAYSKTITFTLQNIATATTNLATIQVLLHGRTSTTTNPDHHTQIFLNNTLVDEAWWDGDIPYTHLITVSQTLFVQGVNTLTLVSPNDTGSSIDAFYLNLINLGVWHTYTAHNTSLYFNTPLTGLNTITITNFITSAIHLYDISNPQQPKQLINANVNPDNNGYHLNFTHQTTTTNHYLALSTHQKQSPSTLLLDTPSSWQSPTNGADYIIITHPDFRQALTPLIQHRTNQGLRVATIDINDIYDEFSAGLFTPQAIKDFLSYAYTTWLPPAPLYILLVGDANYDYKDYLGTGVKNFIPPYLFDSNIIGQTASDNWFVSVSGSDPLPDMFIGRFAVQTTAEVEAIVDKILLYEQTPPPGDWNQNALFIADDDDGFSEIAENLVTQLPSNYTPHRIYGDVYTDTGQVGDDIITAIDAGTLLINYVGHGSTSSWYWDNVNIFAKKDVLDLNNTPYYPLLITGNCNNGFFVHPEAKASMAEQFLRLEDKGAIAAWSPTGLGYPWWHQNLVSSLYTMLFNNYMYQLGPATTAAKIEAYAQLGWSEPVEIFTLFGDPALNLAVAQPQLTFSKSSEVNTIQPGSLLNYWLTYTNTGTAPTGVITLTEIYDPRTTYQTATITPTIGHNVWHLNPLPPNQSQSILITVHLSETLVPGDILLNKAILATDALLPITATAYTLVVGPVLEFSKKASHTQVKPGHLLTYTLHYTNSGNLIAENLILTEIYDPHTSYQTASQPPISGSNNSTWHIASLQPNQSGILTITVQVQESTQPDTVLTNQAILSGLDVEPQLAVNQTLVVQSVLTLSKTPSSSTVQPGQYLTYTLRYTNSGNLVANNILLSESYSPYTKFYTATPTPTFNNNQWYFYTLPPYTSSLITVTVIVSPNASLGLTLTNHITLTADELTPKTAQAETAVAYPIINLNKRATVSHILPGNKLVYLLTYGNTGNQTAYNVILSDTYPLSTTYISANPIPNIANNQWRFGQVSPDLTRTIVLTLQVSPSISNGTAITNHLQLNATNLKAISTSHTLIVEQPFFNLSHRAWPAQVQPGHWLTYTLHYTNQSHLPAHNVIVTDTYPFYTTFYTANIPPSQGDNVWQLNTVSAGETGRLTITLFVSETARFGQTLINQIELNGDEFKPHLSLAHSLIVQPVLQLTKTALISQVQPNQLLTYTLTYANQGNLLAENVWLTEQYDPNTIYHSASTSPTSMDNKWYIGSLAPHEQRTLTLTVQVSETITSALILTNTAILSGPQLKPTIDSAHTLLVRPILTLTKIAAIDEVEPNQFLSYFITYANIGNHPAQNVTLTEMYDSHTSYHTANFPPTVSDNLWQLGNLPPNASATLIVIVHVSDFISTTNVLVNQVSLKAKNLSEITATAQTSLLQPILNITKTAVISQVKPGDLLTYTLHYANQGNHPAQNVILTEFYPPHTRYYAASIPPTQADNIWKLDTVISATNGSLFPNQSGFITVTVEVLNTATTVTQLTNKVILSGDNLLPKFASISTPISTAQTFVPKPRFVYLPLILK